MKIEVYMLTCANKRYYIGSTNDLERRISEHGRGHVKATRNILPINLSYFHHCESLVEARHLERILKNKKSREIIERIVKDQEITFEW